MAKKLLIIGDDVAVELGKEKNQSALVDSLLHVYYHMPVLGDAPHDVKRADIAQSLSGTTLSYEEISPKAEETEDPLINAADITMDTDLPDYDEAYPPVPTNKENVMSEQTPQSTTFIESQMDATPIPTVVTTETAGQMETAPAIVPAMTYVPADSPQSPVAVVTDPQEGEITPSSTPDSNPTQTTPTVGIDPSQGSSLDIATNDVVGELGRAETVRENAPEVLPEETMSIPVQGTSSLATNPGELIDSHPENLVVGEDIPAEKVDDNGAPAATGQVPDQELKINYLGMDGGVCDKHGLYQGPQCPECMLDEI